MRTLHKYAKLCACIVVFSLCAMGQYWAAVGGDSMSLLISRTHLGHQKGQYI